MKVNERHQVLINEEHLNELKNWICAYMEELGFGVDAFELVNLRAYGTRTNGKALENSDLDVLLEYKGSAREDAVFNILHETIICLEGIVVDINPIKAVCSGTTEEYLKRCDDEWKTR